MRRVVVTGLGLVTPLGAGVDTVWQRLCESESGASRIDHFDVDDLACKVAAMVPRLDGRGGGGPDFPGTFNPDDTLAKRDQKRVDEFIVYAIAAADEAMATRRHRRSSLRSMSAADGTNRVEVSRHSSASPPLPPNPNPNPGMKPSPPHSQIVASASAVDRPLTVRANRGSPSPRFSFCFRTMAK